MPDFPRRSVPSVSQSAQSRPQHSDLTYDEFVARVDRCLNPLNRGLSIQTKHVEVRQQPREGLNPLNRGLSIQTNQECKGLSTQGRRSQSAQSRPQHSDCVRTIPMRKSSRLNPLNRGLSIQTRDIGDIPGADLEVSIRSIAASAFRLFHSRFSLFYGFLVSIRSIAASAFRRTFAHSTASSAADVSIRSIAASAFRQAYGCGKALEALGGLNPLNRGLSIQTDALCRYVSDLTGGGLNPLNRGLSIQTSPVRHNHVPRWLDVSIRSIAASAFRR